MKHYLFEDREYGQYIVGADNTYEAWKIVEENCFEASQLIDELTDDEAEDSGLDEY